MIKHFKLKPTLKIIVSSFLIALTIIFSKFIPISNVFSLPFLRISLGPTTLIFASILLGPFYGGIVGVFSDLFGFIFDSTGYAYNPLFTLTYLLYGVLPGLLIYLFKKYKTKFPYVQFLIFIILNIFIIVFFSLNSSIAPYGGKIYEIDLTTKFIVIFSSLGITLLYFIIYLILYKKLKDEEKKKTLNVISLINLITLVFTQLFVGVIIKYITYEVDIIVLFVVQLLATLIELFISNYIVTLLYFIGLKIFKPYLISTNKKEKKVKETIKQKFKRILKEELNSKK